MKITLNNRPEEFDGEQISISEIILKKNFTFKMIVTKINGNLIKRDERNTSFVRNGDDVQIIHLISGG
jgi:thiamine biosynthesis protein ThiS